MYNVGQRNPIVFVGCGVKFRRVLGRLKGGSKIKVNAKMHVGYQMKGIFM